MKKTSTRFTALGMSLLAGCLLQARACMIDPCGYIACDDPLGPPVVFPEFASVPDALHYLESAGILDAYELQLQGE